MAKTLERDPATCRKFLQSERLWTDRLPIPAEFRERQKPLILRAALETDGSEAHKGGEIGRASCRERVSTIV